MEKSTAFEKFNNLFYEIDKYDKCLKQIDKEFIYGTSGFRTDASILHKVSFRVALGLYLKSIEYHGMPFGIMITASHNKYKDNGFKIAAFKGESAPTTWESYFTKIVNTKNLIDFIKEYIQILAEQKSKRTIEDIMNTKALICYAYDTRPSSKEFDEITCDCLRLLNCDFICYQVLTTPGLHYLTLLNQIKFADIYTHNEKKDKFIFCDKADYWIFLKSSNQILENHVLGSKRYLKLNNSSNDDNYENNITFDCANGTAGFLKEKIEEIFSEERDLKCEFINYDYEDYKSLNELSGAEHVQKEKKLPQFFHNKFLNKENNLVEFIKNVSFDGDVDRIIYYSYISEKNELKIIDGDYQTILFAKFIKLLLENLSEKLKEEFLKKICLAIITTAYSNGGFMEYVRNEIKLLELVLAKTGVKHLHHKARDFDIAIYFESNGHGTVFYNEKTIDKISVIKNLDDSNDNDKAILNLLVDFLKAFNPTVGDSLSVVICAEKCFKILNLKCADVYDLYNNIPSVNLKKVVKDKGIYLSNEDDSRLIEPLAIQTQIDEIVKVFKSDLGRCFVRASGTEDIVRIYAEAKSSEIAQKIADQVYELLY